MIEKLKLWLMTDEKKEQYLLDKERDEREKNRYKNDENKSKTKKNKTKKNKKNKGKDNRNTRGKENVRVKEKVVKEKVVKERPKKVIKKVVRKVPEDDKEEALMAFEREQMEVNNKSLLEEKKKEDKIGFKEDKEDKEEFKELDNEDNQIEIEDVFDKEPEPEFEEENDYLRGIREESDKKKKLEMIRKKQEEKEKWLSVMIELPPTSDEDTLIKYALNEGVPEWYLREEGYIKDDEIREEEIFSFSSGLENGKNKESEDVPVVEDNVELDSVDNLSHVKKDNLSDLQEKDVLKSVEDDIKDVSESLEVDDSRTVESVPEGVIDVPEGTGNVSEDESDLLVSEGLEVTGNELEGNIKSDELEDNIESDELEGNIESPEVSMDSLKERLKQLNITKSDGSVDKVEDDDLETSSLADRLAQLKMRREVINKEGNKVLVKEVLDIDGKTKSQYKSYNVSDEESTKVNVGDDLDDSVDLGDSVDESIIIDGEYYNLSEEEENEILDKYGIREIWLLTYDESIYDEAVQNLRDSRYVVRMIKTEKDFLLATRSVSNVILFSMSIPNEVKSSVSNFIKYLQQENKRARLITSERSKVNSQIIEHVISDITVEELDNYFDIFTSDLYSEINKSLVDLYRVISFDITDSLSGDKDISVDKSSLDFYSKGDTEVNFDYSIPIEIEDENPLEIKTGDIELSFSDIILIDDDDDVFNK